MGSGMEGGGCWHAIASGECEPKARPKIAAARENQDRGVDHAENVNSQVVVECPSI